MSEYDQWLLQQADMYMSDCTPTKIKNGTKKGG